VKDGHFSLEPLAKGRVFRIVSYYEGYSFIGSIDFVGQEIVSWCISILFSGFFYGMVWVSTFSKVCSHSLAVEIIFLERGTNPSDTHELPPWRII